MRVFELMDLRLLVGGYLQGGKHTCISCEQEYLVKDYQKTPMRFPGKDSYVCYACDIYGESEGQFMSLPQDFEDRDTEQREQDRFKFFMKSQLAYFR